MPAIEPGQPVRFGIVGLGIGRSRAQMVLQTPGARLQMICDLRPEVAQKYAAKWGCTWTTNFDDMVAREDIDVIGVFTPSGTHADFVIKAAQAGKHAITTKPMEVTLARADAMAAAARQAGVVLAVDFGNRYSDEVRKVKLALDAGRLGRPIFGDMRLKWYRSQEYYDAGSPYPWRGTWRFDGGGSLANQGIHDLDLLQWFMGPLQSVRARINIFTHRIETEDACQAFLTFTSGAWGLVETTTTAWGSPGRAIELHGTNGCIFLADRGIAFWRFQDEDEGRVPPWQPELPPQRPMNVIEDMVSALTKGTTVACPPEEGRKSVAIMEAIYRSARQGGIEVTPEL